VVGPQPSDQVEAPGVVILPKEMFAGERSILSKILIRLEIAFWCREE
jgi:hypothetical protein